MTVGIHLLLIVILFILFALMNVEPSLQHKHVLYHREINALLSPSIFKSTPEQGYRVDIVNKLTPCQKYFDQFSARRNVPALSMSSKRISFKDSNQTWVICHCSTNQHEGWDYLFTHLSCIPLILREQIKTIIAFPIESSLLLPESKTTIQPHGLMSESTAVFFGEPPIGTWIHEFTHALDVNTQGIGREKFSDSRLWKQALQMDACMTDAYAKTSSQEVNADYSTQLLVLTST
jgi:hypothetical protein